LYMDRLVAHAFAVQHDDRLLHLGIVGQLNIAEGWGDARNEVSNNTNGSSFDSARLHPFLQLQIRAVVRYVDEEQLGHRTASYASETARRVAKLSGFRPSTRGL